MSGFGGSGFGEASLVGDGFGGRLSWAIWWAAVLVSDCREAVLMGDFGVAVLVSGFGERFWWERFW